LKVTHIRLVGPEYMLDSMKLVRGKDPTNDLPSLETFYKMIWLNILHLGQLNIGSLLKIFHTTIMFI